jgi:hypothetical protein
LIFHRIWKLEMWVFEKVADVSPHIESLLIVFVVGESEESALEGYNNDCASTHHWQGGHTADHPIVRIIESSFATLLGTAAPR